MPGPIPGLKVGSDDQKGLFFFFDDLARPKTRDPVYCLLGRDPPSGSGPAFRLGSSNLSRLRSQRVVHASLGDRRQLRCDIDPK